MKGVEKLIMKAYLEGFLQGVKVVQAHEENVLPWDAEKPSCRQADSKRKG